MPERQEQPGKLRKLSGEERRLVTLLGMPTFGLALSITVIVTYAGLLAHQFTNSTTTIGIIVGSEGLAAFFLPVAAGSWSDATRTRLGGRLPFLLAGTPIMVAALAVMAFATSLWWLTLMILAFFFAYYISYEPYRALYPDLLGNGVMARAQSVQAIWRGLGTALALVGGGLGFALAKWVPFIGSAVLLFTSVVAFAYLLIKRPGQLQHQRKSTPASKVFAHIRQLMRERRGLRSFIAANIFIEASLSALKTFIVLFITVGLRRSVAVAALIIGIVALGILVAVPFSGKLADRYGIAKIMATGAAAYGAILLLPMLTTSAAIMLPLLPVAAFGGAILLTLPYALLVPMMPATEHGLLTGIYSTSRGIGLMLGPLLAGAAVAIAQAVNIWPNAEGYTAMWFVTGTTALISMPLLLRIHHHTKQA